MRCRFLAFCLFFLTAAVQAQTPGIGAIRGRVVDEAGAPVPAAEVTVTNTATGFTRTTRSDAQGVYVLPELPLTGAYSLRVTHEGFAPQERTGIELRAGETAAIDAVVQVEAVAAAITVYGTTEGVRSDAPQLGTRFDNQKIQGTPLLGRKLTSLPLLNSSVRPARGTGDLFLNNTLFVIDGGGRRQTTFTVDGGTADDAWGRQTIFTNVPLAAIQELTVLTNAFSAEYGRTTGAAINIVTRSGTNDFRGDLTAVSRPGGPQADAPVTGQKARDVLRQGSGFFSGPLMRDKAYWALGGEYSDQDRDSIITSALAPGTFTGHYKQTLLFGRVDADLNPSNHLLGRVNLDRFSDTNPADAVGGIALPSAARTFRRDTRLAQIGETAILSDALFNDARLVWQDGDPITEFAPQHRRPNLRGPASPPKANRGRRSSPTGSTRSPTPCRGRAAVTSSRSAATGSTRSRAATARSSARRSPSASSPSRPASRRRSRPRSSPSTTSSASARASATCATRSTRTTGPASRRTTSACAPTWW